MAKADPQLRVEAIRLLNEHGWNDHKICAAIGSSSNYVGDLRRANGIPAIRRCNRIDDQEAMQLYTSGHNDHEIADALGVDPSSVCMWRKRKELPAHVPERFITDAQKRLARKLLRRGYTKRAVAEEVGCSRFTIQALRREMDDAGLRKSGLKNSFLRRRVINDKKMWSRLENEIGRSVPDHIRTDAVHAMYADLLDGKLAIDQIEKRAPSYRSQAYDMCGSRFGPISLDAENDDGNTLADILSEDMLDPAWHGCPSD